MFTHDALVSALFTQSNPTGDGNAQGGDLCAVASGRRTPLRVTHVTSTPLAFHSALRTPRFLATQHGWGHVARWSRVLMFATHLNDALILFSVVDSLITPHRQRRHSCSRACIHISSPLDLVDDAHRAASIGPLVLGTARHIEPCISKDAREQPADGSLPQTRHRDAQNEIQRKSRERERKKARDREGGDTASFCPRAAVLPARGVSH